MGREILIAALMTTFLWGCEARKASKEKMADSTVENSVQESEKQIIDTTAFESENILLSNIVHHQFSSIQNDTFKLVLRGSSIIDGKVLFQIVNGKGEVLHSEKFTATDLLGDMMPVIPTVKQREDTITKRVKLFFSNSNFYNPAIPTKDSLNIFDTDKNIWNDIKSDASSIGFVYSYGYEGVYGIAYSKKNKKVVLYFSHD